MAFDESLAARIRLVLSKRKGLEEKKMFGGIAFMINGNVCCGVLKDDLLLRLAPEETEQAVSEPHVRPFAMGGRTMKGWIMIAPDGVKTDEKLSAWVRRGAGFASSLPKK